MDLSKGNHRMLYEPPNRGRKTINALNRGVGGNDPGSVADVSLLGNSFLMPQGYSISFSGWDFSAEKNMGDRSGKHTSELQSQSKLVCRLLLGKKKKHVTFELVPRL